MATITQATPADLDVLTQLFDAYRVFYGKSSDQAGARVFLEARLRNNESIAYLAFEDGVAVAFTQLYPLFSSTRMKPVWLLNDLFVAPEHRGKGISKQLLERAKQLARDTGKTNDIGNQLYPSAGFELGTDVNWYHFEFNGE